MKSKKLIFLSCIIVALAVVVILFSRSISFDFPEGESIRILMFSDEVSVENFAAIPSGEARTIDILPSSNEYQELIPILKNLRYSYCVHTLFNDWFPLTDENIETILDIYKDKEEIQYVSKLVPNDEIAKEDY